MDFVNLIMYLILPIEIVYKYAYNKFMTENHSTNGKTRITIRIDNDVLDWFRNEVETAGGGNYQTMLNRALREYIQNRAQFSESTLRRIIREELAANRNLPATFKSNTIISR